MAVVVASGRYSLRELEDAIDEALAQTAGYGRVSGLMVDYTGSEILPERRVSELEGAARFFGSRGERFGGRLALIAATDVGYGLLRIVSAHAERRGLDTIVFRDYASAIRWLDGTSAVTGVRTSSVPRHGTPDASVQ